MKRADVGFWHKADIAKLSACLSAFGGKADLAQVANYERMSASDPDLTINRIEIPQRSEALT